MSDKKNESFNGVFDGQNHSIYGFYYKGVNSLKYIGLFGYANEYSMISNTNIAYVYLSGTTSVDKYIGGVCGYSKSKTVSNCSSDGVFFVEISGYPKTDNGTLNIHTGGICGGGGPNVNCRNTADVTAISTSAIKYNAVGGIVGSGGCAINCINEGSIIFLQKSMHLQEE